MREGKGESFRVRDFGILGIRGRALRGGQTADLES